jgi:hypothetical protein
MRQPPPAIVNRPQVCKAWSGADDPAKHGTHRPAREISRLLPERISSSYSIVFLLGDFVSAHSRSQSTYPKMIAGEQSVAARLCPGKESHETFLAARVLMITEQ